MPKDKVKKLIVRCFRSECEFNDPQSETCVNDELSVGQSGICLCIDDAEEPKSEELDIIDTGEQ